MFRCFKPFILLFIIAVLLVTSKPVDAAFAPFDFAIPTERDRFQNAIALIRQDNTMELIDIDYQELHHATINHNGTKIAYSIRHDNRIKVFIANTDGSNPIEVCDYRSDPRNVSDFIAVRFIRNGQILLMARFIRNELAFLEYDVARNRTRFLRRIDWQTGALDIYSVDVSDNGKFAFKSARHMGGNILQQVWTSHGYEDKTGVSFEMEAPPTIVGFASDLDNNRIFAVTTNTRHMPVREVPKSLSIIDGVNKEPKVLLTGELFLQLQMSNDGRYLIWRSTPVGEKPKFKRYNIATGEISEIPAATEEEEPHAAQPGPAG